MQVSTPIYDAHVKIYIYITHVQIIHKVMIISTKVIIFLKKSLFFLLGACFLIKGMENKINFFFQFNPIKISRENKFLKSKTCY